MAATKQLASSQPAGCKVLPPQVMTIDPEQLARLEEGDRRLLARLFEEPLEYVNHKLFAKPNAEQLLFGRTVGEDGEVVPSDSVSDEPVETKSDSGTLNSAQEILLFQRFNYARMRIARIFEKADGLAMSDACVKDLLVWARRATAARCQIVQANIPLVLAMAKRTRLSGLDFNELISEGNLALLRSVDKFDCSRGFKFSTYACRAILKSFSRVALRTSRYRGRFPTEFDPTLEKSDFIDRKRDGLEADCVEEIREILAENRAELNDMERTVIRERFALDAGPESPRPKTLEQVGELIGVTKERVRQIQNKALRKIRLILEDNFLAA